jgi:hypothetical protein
MGQFVQTNGDYNIKTKEGARITLNTGPGVGEVRVTGNLLVEGDTLTVSAENLNVNDNVIILNYGETGAGVTLRYSGIQIDRGTEQPATIIFDENDNTWNFAYGSPEGVFSWSGTRIRVSEITTDSGTDLGDLGFDVGNTGVLKVTSSAGTYRLRVTDPDDIPNKDYVDQAIQDNPTFQILSDNSRVIVTDKEVAGSLTYFASVSNGYTTYGESAVSVLVDGALSAQFYTNRLEVGDIEIGGGPDKNEITSRAGITNENIYVRTQGTGKLQTNYGLQLEHMGTSGETPPLAAPYNPLIPAPVTGNTIVYGDFPSIGASGLYFVNDHPTVRKQSGELISKNKALLFSMIF